MDKFKQAAKDKVRFASGKGDFTVEDLYDLSLESLDTIAKRVNKALKETEEESFIGKKSRANTELTLQLDILKEVIADKIAEKEATKERLVRNEKINRIQNLLIEKKDEELKGKSAEDLSKMLEELQA